MSYLWSDLRFFEETVKVKKLKDLLDAKSHNGLAGIQERIKAMKWLLAMMSKGRDVSDFYPDVVKNVIVKSVELKKLVYIFLMHYADHDSQCRELALLSINTFQKDMLDPNPLIRALALRTMSSIRNRDIGQLQIMAVNKCSVDNSAYVRKICAHAVCKIYRLNEEHEETLVNIVGKLLHDHSLVVISSALNAYQEICPLRYDLIHPCYKKLCKVLVDLNEWGQITLLTILARYCRVFFLNPDSDASESQPYTGGDYQYERSQRVSNDGNSFHSISTVVRPRQLPTADELASFYSHTEGLTSKSEQPEKKYVAPLESEKLVTPAIHEIDPDQNLLLTLSLPLLRSRNSGVVLSVIALHWHCGIRSHEVLLQIAKSLIRLLHSNREVKFVILNSILNIVKDIPSYFQPYLSDFYVNTSDDPAFIRHLKIKIVAIVADAQNIDMILTEFETYVAHPNKTFVCDVVNAIGDIASRIPEVAERCLQGLLTLTTSNSDKVVASAVVVIRKLLQQHSAYPAVVQTIVGLSDKIKSPLARASIVWIATEYIEHVQVVAVELLRTLAFTFTEEAKTVKMQILNLAVRLSIHEIDIDPINQSAVLTGKQKKQIEHAISQVKELQSYVFELARYDTDCDIRDYVRFLSAVVDKQNELCPNAAELLFPSKPLPLSETSTEKLSAFALNSLSSTVNYKAKGYIALLEWPQEKPDSSIRDAVLLDSTLNESRSAVEKQRDRFYSSSFSSSSSSLDGSSSSGTSESGSSGSSSSDSDSRSDVPDQSLTLSVSNDNILILDEQEGVDKLVQNHIPRSAKTHPVTPPQDDILSLFDPNVNDRKSGTVSNPSTSVRTGFDKQKSFQPALVNTQTSRAFRTMLNHTHGGGLQIEYWFTRELSKSCLVATKLGLSISSRKSVPMNSIRLVCESKTLSGSDENGTVAVDRLFPGERTEAFLKVNFQGEWGKKIEISVDSEHGKFVGNVVAPLGELLIPPLRPVSADDFDRLRKTTLGGMHESSRNIPQHMKVGDGVSGMRSYLREMVLKKANLCAIPDSQQWPLRFMGVLNSDPENVRILVTVNKEALIVNSDNMIMSNTLVDDLINQ